MNILLSRSIIVLLTCLLQTICSFSQFWIGLDEGFGCGTYNVREIAGNSNGGLATRGGFSFTSECIPTPNISLWSGSTWESLGCNDGIGGGGNLLWYDSKLITTGQQVCGSDTLDCRVLIWDNNEWSSLWISDEIAQGYDIISHNSSLYFTGSYRFIGGESFGMVFKLDGDMIVPLIEESSFSEDSHFGNALTYYHDTLYVGGKFASANQDERSDNLAAIYDSSIHRVNMGLSYGLGIVESLCVHRDTLFIGGLFMPDPLLQIEDTTCLLYYDGQHLGSYGVNATDRITCMQSYNDELYIGGWFESMNDIPCVGVGKLNGHQLSALNTYPFYASDGTQQNPQIFDLEIVNDSVLIAGNFMYIGDSSPLGGVAKLNADITEDVQHYDALNKFRLLQNPVSTQIDFSIPPTHPVFQARLFDVNGHLLKTVDNDNIIDVSHLSSGVYVLMITCKNYQYSFRVIVL